MMRPLCTACLLLLLIVAAAAHAAAARPLDAPAAFRGSIPRSLLAADAMVMPQTKSKPSTGGSSAAGQQLAVQQLQQLQQQLTQLQQQQKPGQRAVTASSLPTAAVEAPSKNKPLPAQRQQQQDQQRPAAPQAALSAAKLAPGPASKQAAPRTPSMDQPLDDDSAMGMNAAVNLPTDGGAEAELPAIPDLPQGSSYRGFVAVAAAEAGAGGPGGVGMLAGDVIDSLGL